MRFDRLLLQSLRDFPWRAALLGRPYTFLIGTLIASAIAVVTTFYIRSEAERSHEQSRHAAESVANLINHQVDQDFAKIGVLLRMIRNDRMQTDLVGRPRSIRETSELFRLFPDIEAIVVTDRAGRELERLLRRPTTQAESPDPWPISREDARSSGDIRLTGPIRSPYSGEWVVTLCIDLLSRDGEKEGSALVSLLSSSYFRSVLSQPRLGEHGAATIRMRDLSLVYRSLTPKNDEIGTQNTSLELRSALRHAPDEGNFTARTALDGIERINAYRRIGHYPLYVLVGLATEDNQRHWLITERLIIGLAALSIVLLLFFSLTHAASAYRQRELTQRVSTEAEKLAAIFEGCNESIHILDPVGNLLKANTAFYQLIGRSERETGINMVDWTPDHASPLIERLHTLSSNPRAGTARTTATFVRTNGDQIQVEIGVARISYEGMPAFCASARDITAEKRNAELLQYMFSEYRRLNDELEFRAQCCKAIHETNLPCLARAIPSLLSDLQELLLVLRASRDNSSTETPGNFLVLMDRARQLLEAMNEIVHRAHHRSEPGSSVGV